MVCFLLVCLFRTLLRQARHRHQHSRSHSISVAFREAFHLSPKKDPPSRRASLLVGRVQPQGKHLLIFCHGYQGNSWDMRLFKNHLQVMCPNALFLVSSENENKTEVSFIDDDSFGLGLLSGLGLGLLFIKAWLVPFLFNSVADENSFRMLLTFFIAS